MTELLQKAIAEMQKLPETQQDDIARLVLDLLEDEARWQAAFERSQDALAQLADEALADYKAGRTQPLDPDAL